MGIASMVIGIVALLVGFMPIIGVIGFVPASVGLILGIVDVVLKGKKRRPRGMGIAGVVLSVATMAVIFIPIFAARSNSSGPVQFKNAYVVQIGGNADMRVYEFENTSSTKTITAFKGKMIVYDENFTDKEIGRFSLEWRSPVGPQEKLYINRMILNGRLSSEGGKSTPEILEQYAKERGVNVEQFKTVNKMQFKCETVVYAE